jgi:hypothetical protein
MNHAWVWNILACGHRSTSPHVRHIHLRARTASNTRVAFALVATAVGGKINCWKNILKSSHSGGKVDYLIK